MIPIKTFKSIELKARQALKKGDGAALDAINADPDAIKINMLLIVRAGEIYVYDRAIWLEKHSNVPCYSEEWA